MVQSCDTFCPSGNEEGPLDVQRGAEQYHERSEPQRKRVEASLPLPPDSRGLHVEALLWPMLHKHAVIRDCEVTFDSPNWPSDPTAQDTATTSTV